MSPIDPVFASVLQRRLKALTEEMGVTLLRTTRSVESARTHYGVWVDPETFAVERELTRAGRAAGPRRAG